MTTDTGYVDITAKYSVTISDKQEIRSDTKTFCFVKKKRRRKYSRIHTSIVRYNYKKIKLIILLTLKQLNFLRFTEKELSQKKYNGAFQILESDGGVLQKNTSHP